MLTANQKTVFTLAVATVVSIIAGFVYHRKTSDRIEDAEAIPYERLIGNTPLVLLKEASRISGCRIYAKMESMNPGGTGKDRAALSMLREAQRSNPIYGLHCNIVEGTSGSTGIALATLCRARGLQLHVVMPDDQADEKRRLLECLGVKVHIVPNCAISNPNHYVNAARKLAKDIGGIFMNQFENIANYQAHFDTTGPEIWSQTGGRLDAFVMSAGTGGTIAGVSQYLKSQLPTHDLSGRNSSSSSSSSKEEEGVAGSSGRGGGGGVQVVLADPQGSSLFNRVTQGVCYTSEQAETRLKKHRYDSLVEGVGLDRVTANFQNASIDSAESVSDQEVLNTAHWLLANEGLFVGSSSALNVAAALRVAKRLGPGATVVTIICDTGQRHLSRFWNPDYIGKYSLQWPEEGKCVLPACIQAFAAS